MNERNERTYQSMIAGQIAATAVVMLFSGGAESSPKLIHTGSTPNQASLNLVGIPGIFVGSLNEEGLVDEASLERSELSSDWSFLHFSPRSTFEITLDLTQQASIEPVSILLIAPKHSPPSNRGC